MCDKSWMNVGWGFLELHDIDLWLLADKDREIRWRCKKMSSYRCGQAGGIRLKMNGTQLHLLVLQHIIHVHLGATLFLFVFYHLGNWMSAAWTLRAYCSSLLNIIYKNVFAISKWKERLFSQLWSEIKLTTWDLHTHLKYFQLLVAVVKEMSELELENEHSFKWKWQW